MYKDVKSCVSSLALVPFSFILLGVAKRL